MAFRILVVLFQLLITSQATAQIVIAHRGASGYLPEHTLEAAILAYSQGADYIEQDLVLSKDGVPVVLHDIHLETVTDVEQVFPKRKREDGRYYALDFTLTELKQLRVHERHNGEGKQVFPGRYQGQSDFRIATFEQHIELINQLNRQFGKHVGLYPEIKSPAWHREQGADISVVVLQLLRKHGLDSADSKIYIQCFDFAETQRWRNELGAKMPLVQLIAENGWAESATDYDYLKSPAGLKDIAKVAQGIGPWIPQLVNLETMQPTGLVTAAHAEGLVVHPYTFRKDQLPEAIVAEQALGLLFGVLKVDGVFTDFTDVTRSFLDKARTQTSR